MTSSPVSGSVPTSTLLVHSDTAELRLSVPEGRSVRDALDVTPLRVRAACGGTGACGACLVRLLQGEVTPPTLAEFQKLTAEERAKGMRLACQLRLRGDAEVRLDDPAPPSLWTSIPPEDLWPAPAGQPDLTRHIYGVAVDLGTTHIRVALWDRKHGQRLATRRGPNPQSGFGADVLNRLDAALASPERAAELAKLARNAIVQAVRDILKRDVGEVRPMLAEIGRVVIVGNTAMLTLLTGVGAGPLLEPANWERTIDHQPRDPATWQAQWFMPNVEIVLPGTVAGFVGSDLVADLVATGLSQGPAGSLLLDVGTNTEMALWDGQTLHVTSVPGGPAFEGVGIHFGMPAENGAICRVRPIAGGYELATIGGTDAHGYCGSGLTDAVAVLLANGGVKASGRFAQPPGAGGYRLDPGNPRSALFGSDIDAFQRAKAAMAAAMATLMEQAGMNWTDLRRLCVCGAFGRTLDVGHAQAVGLLPPIAPERVELFSDATLAGCERLLLGPTGAPGAREVMNPISAVNLTKVIGYDDRYIDHLRLKPMRPVLTV